MQFFKSAETKQESNPLARTLYESALTAIKNGNSEFAISEMDQILSKFPESEEADLVRELRGAQTEKVKADQERLQSIILTTETVTNLNITERLDVISAECVYGMNVFRDLFASVRDAVGGRSAATQNVLRDARKEVLAELKREAFELGADAVVAVDIDYSEFSGAGKSMLMIVATGTAVKINATEKNKA